MVDAAGALRRPAVTEQVAILADRAGEGSDPHEVAVDLGDLCDGADVAGADDESGTLADQVGVTGVAEECPRQPGVVFGVQIDPEIQRWGHSGASEMSGV